MLCVYLCLYSAHMSLHINSKCSYSETAVLLRIAFFVLADHLICAEFVFPPALM